MDAARQLAALDDLLRRAGQMPEVEAVILIGSLASGTADAMSLLTRTRRRPAIRREEMGGVDAPDRSCLRPPQQLVRRTSAGPPA
jgi:hypothetical protein